MEAFGALKDFGWIFAHSIYNFAKLGCDDWCTNGIIIIDIYIIYNNYI